MERILSFPFLSVFLFLFDNNDSGDHNQDNNCCGNWENRHRRIAGGILCFAGGRLVFRGGSFVGCNCVRIVIIKTGYGKSDFHILITGSLQKLPAAFRGFGKSLGSDFFDKLGTPVI